MIDLFKYIQKGLEEHLSGGLATAGQVHTEGPRPAPKHLSSSQRRMRVMSVHRLGLERTFCHWSFDCELVCAPPGRSSSV